MRHPTLFMPGNSTMITMDDGARPWAQLQNKAINTCLTIGIHRPLTKKQNRGIVVRTNDVSGRRIVRIRIFDILRFVFRHKVSSNIILGRGAAGYIPRTARNRWLLRCVGVIGMYNMRIIERVL